MNYLLLCHGLGGNVKESARKGLERGAKKIQKNAKHLAPVDTGQLRNSIKTKSEIKDDEVTAQAYTNCEHAIYPEFRYRTKRFSK